MPAVSPPALSAPGHPLPFHWVTAAGQAPWSRGVAETHWKIKPPRSGGSGRGLLCDLERIKLFQGTRFLPTLYHLPLDVTDPHMLQSQSSPNILEDRCQENPLKGFSQMKPALGHPDPMPYSKWSAVTVVTNLPTGVGIWHGD